MALYLILNIIILRNFAGFSSPRGFPMVKSCVSCAVLSWLDSTWLYTLCFEYMLWIFGYICEKEFGIKTLTWYQRRGCQDNLVARVWRKTILETSHLGIFIITLFRYYLRVWILHRSKIRDWSTFYKNFSHIFTVL